MLAMSSFGLMLFVQYSYPSSIQGKMFGVFLLFVALGGAVLPVVNEIKKDFEMGWQVYRKLMVALSSAGIFLGSMLLLLAFNKD